jgi:hypothetical protein
MLTPAQITNILYSNYVFFVQNLWQFELTTTKKSRHRGIKAEDRCWQKSSHFLTNLVRISKHIGISIYYSFSLSDDQVVTVSYPPPWIRLYQDIPGCQVGSRLVSSRVPRVMGDLSRKGADRLLRKGFGIPQQRRSRLDCLGSHIIDHKNMHAFRGCAEPPVENV